MKQYEAMIILKPELQSDALKIAYKEAMDIIKKHQGNVDEANELGKKPLAYDIGKKKEGFFYLLKFKGNPETIKEMNREFALNENVLRAMITIKGG